MIKNNEKKKGLISTLLSNPLIKTILFIGLLIGILIVLSRFGLKIYTKHGESVEVPSVGGLQVEEAAGILSKASLSYQVVDSVYLTNGVPGAIIDQIPEEKSKVKKDRIIFLKIQAKSIEMITIPPLKDFSQRQAITTLSSLGFNNVVINEVSSAYRGLVIDITYKGQSLEPFQRLPKGDPLTLTVGAGGEVMIDSLIDIMPDMMDSDAVELSQPDNNPVVEESFFD